MNTVRVGFLFSMSLIYIPAIHVKVALLQIAVLDCCRLTGFESPKKTDESCSRRFAKTAFA